MPNVVAGKPPKLAALEVNVALSQLANETVELPNHHDVPGANELQPSIRSALAQRPILEAAGVGFEKIANDEAAWSIDLLAS